MSKYIKSKYMRESFLSAIVSVARLMNAREAYRHERNNELIKNFAATLISFKQLKLNAYKSKFKSANLNEIFV